MVHGASACGAFWGFATSCSKPCIGDTKMFCPRLLSSPTRRNLRNHGFSPGACSPGFRTVRASASKQKGSTKHGWRQGHDWTSKQSEWKKDILLSNTATHNSILFDLDSQFFFALDIILTIFVAMTCLLRREAATTIRKCKSWDKKLWLGLEVLH